MSDTIKHKQHGKYKRLGKVDNDYKLGFFYNPHCRLKFNGLLERKIKHEKKKQNEIIKNELLEVII